MSCAGTYTKMFFEAADRALDRLRRDAVLARRGSKASFIGDGDKRSKRAETIHDYSKYRKNVFLGETLIIYIGIAQSTTTQRNGGDRRARQPTTCSGPSGSSPTY